MAAEMDHIVESIRRVVDKAPPLPEAAVGLLQAAGIRSGSRGPSRGTEDALAADGANR